MTIAAHSPEVFNKI
jgi:hypothetical protein